MTENAVAPFQTFGPLIGDVGANYALITPGRRVIGDLYPHVVVEETHADELAITQHPVEYGAPVTDHAFLQPQTVEIRCGWSNSTAQTTGYVQAVYQAFLGLQASRVPFSISTGKRNYTSMLLRSLLVKTDADSEYTLMCIAIAQQVIITNTQMTSAGAAPMTNGTNRIGKLPANATGEMPPVVDNGIGTLPPGSMVTVNGFGDMVWPNDVAGFGTQQLVAQP